MRFVDLYDYASTGYAARKDIASIPVICTSFYCVNDWCLKYTTEYVSTRSFVSIVEKVLVSQEVLPISVAPRASGWCHETGYRFSRRTKVCF
jgi:hypothetical protein